MMQLLLLVAHVVCFASRNSAASQDLFSTYNNINENSVDDLSFEPLALGDSGNVAQQADFLDLDSNFTPNTNMWSLSDSSPISFETSGNAVENTNPIAGGCSSSNKLGKRNEATSCPNPDSEKLGIPTFEELTGAVESLHKTLEDKICSPPRLFHLCCICGGFTSFALCDECDQYNALIGCFAPYIQVCCKTFGVYWRSPGWTNLDDWTDGQETLEQYRASGSSIAEDCVAVAI